MENTEQRSTTNLVEFPTVCAPLFSLTIVSDSSPIPTFPQFKKISLSDREAVEAFTSKYRPYSDFNFTNLWLWDTTKSRLIYNLKGNLVIIFSHYLTCEPFLSFLGNHSVESTALQLIQFAHENGFAPELKFIAEEVLHQLDRSAFNITEDEKNFDYIFSIAQISDLKNHQSKSKRRLIKKFSEFYPEAKLVVESLGDKDIQQQVIAVVRKWEINKIAENKNCELKHEEIALQRLLETINEHTLLLSSLYVDGKMIGFSIDEVLPNKFALSHFIKADSTFLGVYEFLNERVAQNLLSKGLEKWNWEQDLNLEGLRQLKKSYRPIEFIKKYCVTLGIPK